jgi:hypothetical protein
LETAAALPKITGVAAAAETTDVARRRRIKIPPLYLLGVALVAAIAAPIWMLLYWPEERHINIPLEISAFSGAALAFLAALAWDRHSRLQEETRQAEAERRRTAARLEQEQERRVIEAKRRFGALALELERLQASIDRTRREQHAYKLFFPDLPTGSWQAASGALGVIVSDYELMADLSTFYGHVEELRWRLRFKAQPDTDEAHVNSMIDTLVTQMADAVETLIEQVREQADRPQVEQVAGAPSSGRGPTKRVARRRQFTGAIRAQTPEEIERALAQQRLTELEGTAPAPDGTA